MLNSNNLFSANQLKAPFVHILLTSLLLAALLTALSASAHLPGAETYAPAASTPTINGVWDQGEWDDAPQYNLSTAGGYFRAKHDASYVYVIIDLINEGPHGACHFIYFDTAHDGGNATELPGDLQFHCCAPPNKLGYGVSPNSATDHRITEFKVALTDLGSPSLPVEMGFYVKALSNDGSTLYEWPSGAGGSYSWDPWDGTPVPDNWGDIHISEAPSVLLPVARFTLSPPKPYVNGTVIFNASHSKPGFNGTHYMPIANYTWNFDDGNVTTVSEPVIYHTYTVTGNYTVTLNVTDTQGLWNTTLRNIEVLSAPPPSYGPTADFSYSPSSPGMNERVTFDALDSLPGWNGTHVMSIANYTWSFSDTNVTTTTNPVITHVYTAVGTYTVNLTVMCEDDPVLISEGLTSSSTWQNITVLDKTAPTIANVVQSPVAAEVDPSEDVTITAIDVIDNVGVDKVLLMYSTDNVTFKNVSMVLVSGTNNYTGQIPGQAADTYVTYKVFVNDTSGNPYETSVYAYRVNKAEVPIPWLWIGVGGTVAVIAIVAIYIVARKISA